MILALAAPALAAGPHRGPLPRPPVVYWEEGREAHVLRVKFAGAPRWPDLGGATPRRVPGLDGWWVLVSPEAEAIGTELLADPGVETAYLAFAPVPPPADIDPPTPDFRSLQTWMDAFPGMGLAEAARWPGGTAANVRIADVEYGWDPDHEDLERTIGASAGGVDRHEYLFHGNAVLGQLVGTPNGYGVDGAVPDAQLLVISPWVEAERYDVAEAIGIAAAQLSAGDVLLVEQQAWANDGYCPISVDPAVFDAIAAAVRAGIVVVEPAGNGAQDLDDAAWDGWFDPIVNDSGSILVGGGASPDSGFTPRAWYPSGSSYGARVDVQGWFDSVVTATGDDWGDFLADLYYPNEDGRQAYTRSFNGTSAASPMVAAAAAVAQSVSIELTGAPWHPLDLRAALVATGTPQAGAEHIGPMPDLRRLLRTYFLP